MNRGVVAALTILLVMGTTTVSVQAQSGEPPPRTTVHIVQRGETLFSIAQRYGLTVDAITHANGIPDPRQIYVGQRLVIPSSKTDASVTETVPYIFQAGDTLVSVAKRYGTTWHTLAQINDLLAPDVSKATPGKRPLGVRWNPSSGEAARPRRMSRSGPHRIWTESKLPPAVGPF